MKKILSILTTLAFSSSLALADGVRTTGVTVSGTAPSVNDCAKFLGTNTIGTTGSACGAGGGGTPGGSNTQVQYNNAGAFGGITGATTNGTLLTLSTPVINGAPTGSGVSASATASTLVLRDANKNAFSNNFVASATSTASAGGVTTLTAASSLLQILTGTLNQTYQLPDATTLTVGSPFAFNNNSSGTLTITNNGGTTITTVPAGGYVLVSPLDVSTANGTWDNHPLAPITAAWSSSFLDMNTSLTTTPRIVSGVASATAPVFLPQRGTTNTGFSGDATHVYGVVGGATSFTSTATTFNIPSGANYQINGTQISASNLSNGVSGTGAVCLASGSSCGGSVPAFVTAMAVSTGTQFGGL